MGEYRVLHHVSRIIVAAVLAAVLYSLYRYIYIDSRVLFSVESPIVFPALLAGVFFIFILLDFFLSRKSRCEDSKNGCAPEIKKEFFHVFFFLIGMGAYILLLPVLHFVPGTIIFMTVIAFLLNTSKDGFPAKLLKSLISAAVIVPLLYYVFYGVFKVVLP